MAAVAPAVQNEAGDLTIAQVTPTTGPASAETEDLVATIREKADEVQADSGIRAYVTGTTALNIDTADQLSSSLPRYIAVVVGLALLLLTVVFRSILVPIKAALGFLLSIGASMGLTVWIFQDGNLADLFNVASEGPVVPPVLLIGILFGLAMDYEVFLVSRIREQFVKTGDARESIVTGFGHSGRVVTAAAVIMTAVFGAFLLDTDPVIKSIGLSLAFGVLVDAFVVRMTIVPAVLALLGRRAWALPRGVGRLCPTSTSKGRRCRGASARRPRAERGVSPRRRARSGGPFVVQGAGSGGLPDVPAAALPHAGPMTPLPFAAALFDLDGVLTSTSTLHAASWKQTFEELVGLPFDTGLDYLTHVDGKPRDDGARDFLLSRGVHASEQLVRDVGTHKQALVERALERDGVEAFPGSVRWVRQLRAQGLKTAVVSSSANCDAVLRAARIDDLFELTVDGAAIERLGLRGKPAPDGFLEAAGRLGVPPSRVIVVEDALAGVAAGRRGGFGLVVGVARSASAAALRAAGADLVVGDLAELAA